MLVIIKGVKGNKKSNKKKVKKVKKYRFRLASVLFVHILDWWHWLDVLFIEYDWLSDFTDRLWLLNGWSIIKESQCIRILRINISNNQSHNCKDYAYYLVLGLCVRDYVGQDGQKYHFHDS